MTIQKPDTLLSEFQSTPPARGATTLPRMVATEVAISIHAPREGGDSGVDQIITRFNISIHAPREGGDCAGGDIVSLSDISIHAPREGGDHDQIKNSLKKIKFQSTPPARGATLILTRSCVISVIFQSTPPARGATSPS